MKKENIILLHGALGSKTQLAPLKAILSKNFAVHDINFEGHGDRPSDNDYSIDLFAQNILDFLEEKGISRTHIFGYSMGGYVGLKLASKNHKTVDRIITLGTKFNWTKEIAAQEIKMLNPAKVEEKVPAFAKRLEELHTGNNWKVVMNKTAKLMVDLGDGKKMSDHDLKSIENETLVGIGALDRMVTLEESEHAASLLPNGALKVIEEFKHPIEKVDMSKLASVILDFIQKNDLS